VAETVSLLAAGEPKLRKAIPDATHTCVRRDSGVSARQLQATFSQGTTYHGLLIRFTPWVTSY
jgi:hypothetical protein